MISIPLNVCHGVHLELALLQSHFNHTVRTRAVPSPRGYCLQDKSIKTKLLKPQKFGRNKDCADATAYTVDQNDGVGLYYVMVNLYRDIFQSHKRTLGLIPWDSHYQCSLHKVPVRVTEHSLAGPSGSSAGGTRPEGMHQMGSVIDPSHGNADSTESPVFAKSLRSIVRILQMNLRILLSS